MVARMVKDTDIQIGVNDTFYKDVLLECSMFSDEAKTVTAKNESQYKDWQQKLKDKSAEHEIQYKAYVVSSLGEFVVHRK